MRRRGRETWKGQKKTKGRRKKDKRKISAKQAVECMRLNLLNHLKKKSLLLNVLVWAKPLKTAPALEGGSGRTRQRHDWVRARCNIDLMAWAIKASCYIALADASKSKYFKTFLNVPSVWVVTHLYSLCSSAFEELFLPASNHKVWPNVLVNILLVVGVRMLAPSNKSD